MNHETERTSRVLAESLSEFDLKLNKGAIIGQRVAELQGRHLGFPWFQAPLGQNFG